MLRCTAQLPLRERSERAQASKQEQEHTASTVYYFVKRSEHASFPSPPLALTSPNPTPKIHPENGQGVRNLGPECLPRVGVDGVVEEPEKTGPPHNVRVNTINS
jgi:hypothetical protein